MLSTLAFWRLSAFYLLNCAVLGAVLAHWPLYLRDIGLSPAKIGIIASLQVLMTVIAPYFWVMVSERTGQLLRVVQWGNVLALLLFAGVLLVEADFWWLAFLVSASSFCWQGLNSQFEMFTLRQLGDKAQHYSQIRLWGSVGFIASTWLIGRICHQYGISILPYLIIGLLAMLVAVTFINKSDTSHAVAVNTKSSYLGILSPVWIGLFVVFFLVNLSHGAYYGFYSIMLTEHGVDSAGIGDMWSVAVLAELATFAALPWVLKRVSLQTILMISIVFTALRWWGISHAEANIYSLVLWQLAHGLSFSAVHTCAMLLIRQKFPAEQQAKGIAIYTAFCIGAGQALGIMLAGSFWHWSSASVFEFCAVIALLALPLGWWALRQQPQAQNSIASR